MSNEKVTTALYQKMYDEQNKFRDWLLEQPQEEVLNHACEYTIREDILMEVGDMELSESRAKALLKSPCPLADIYKDWQRQDSTDHMENIRGIVEDRADDVLYAERKKSGKER